MKCECTYGLLGIFCLSIVLILYSCMLIISVRPRGLC